MTVNVFVDINFYHIECQRAADNFKDTRAHEPELLKGMREENWNPVFIIRLTGHIFRVEEKLEEYRQLILDFHEATGNTSFWQSMAKQVEETTDFYNMARYHIQRAHAMREESIAVHLSNNKDLQYGSS